MEIIACIGAEILIHRWQLINTACRIAWETLFGKIENYLDLFLE